MCLDLVKFMGNWGFFLVYKILVVRFIVFNQNIDIDRFKIKDIQIMIFGSYLRESYFVIFLIKSEVYL